jgi:hypothetical protein
VRDHGSSTDSQVYRNGCVNARMCFQLSEFNQRPGRQAKGRNDKTVSGKFDSNKSSVDMGLNLAFTRESHPLTPPLMQMFASGWKPSG